MKKKTKKLTVVDPDKVATWVEAHPRWTEPADAARDFDADMVIFLEVEQFQIQAPGDLNVVHGDSKIHILAFEMHFPTNSRDKPLKDQPKEAHDVYNDYAREQLPQSRAAADRFGNQSVRVQEQVPEIVVTEARGTLSSTPKRLDPGLANREVRPNGHLFVLSVLLR